MRSVYLVPGVVLGVIWARRRSLRHIRVGVRKRSIRVRYPVYRLIPVDRLARGPERDVRTRAIPSVMPGRVRRVRPWARPRIVSAGGTRPLSGARTPTTRMGGAVVRSVGICCPVESIFAHGRAMRASAVLAMSRSSRSVIVVVCRQKCCAAPGTRRWTVSCNYMTGQWKAGPAASAVESRAVVPLIVESISARRAAIHKTHIPPIVPDRPTWCSIALVGRRH